jgi:DinB superfamily
MSEVIKSAKQDFERSRNRMMSLLKETPDDRLNWSPSPNARTPLAIVAHSAMSLHHVTEMLKGRPFGVPNTKAADKDFRESENDFKTREEVCSLFEKNAAVYIAWIDNLSEEGLNDPITFPFGLGQGTVRDGIDAPARHTEAHIGQLEYIQTIYGDHNWHIGV